MAQYNSVVFSVIGESGLYQEWVQEPNVTVRHIPYSNQDDVQTAGRGNFTVTVGVLLETAGALAALQASVGSTARTLYEFLGATHASVLLVGVSDARRYGSSNKILATLSFNRAGA